jgi:hypothetical protein
VAPGADLVAPGADLAALLARDPHVTTLRDALAAGPLELIAAGVSMRPCLLPGERVRLEARRPRSGEIVLAVTDARLVLHRMLRHREGLSLLCGDARIEPDGWVPDDRILAVATARGGRAATAQWRRLDGTWQRIWGCARAAVTRAVRRARASRAPVQSARRDAATRSTAGA